MATLGSIQFRQKLASYLGTFVVLLVMTFVINLAEQKIQTLNGWGWVVWVMVALNLCYMGLMALGLRFILSLEKGYIELTAEILERFAERFPAESNKLAGVYHDFIKLVKAEGISLRDVHFAVLTKDNSLNAFAGGVGSQKVVVITWGLFTKLERPQIKAVLAHEVGHLHSRDLIWTLISQGIIGAALMISSFLLNFGEIIAFAESSSDDSEGGGFFKKFGWIAAIGIAFWLIGILIAKPLMMFVNRAREYFADRYAVEQGLGAELASALETIKAHSANQRRIKSPALSLIGFAGLQLNTPLAGLFSTHPPIDDRVKMIRSKNKPKELGLFGWIVFLALIAGTVYFGMEPSLSPASPIEFLGLNLNWGVNAFFIAVFLLAMSVVSSSAKDDIEWGVAVTGLVIALGFCWLGFLNFEYVGLELASKGFPLASKVKYLCIAAGVFFFYEKVGKSDFAYLLREVCVSICLLTSLLGMWVLSGGGLDYLL